MKIGWIADFTNTTRSGGAQLTDRFVIDELSKRHVVIEYGIHNVLSSDMMLTCDFYVIGNWVNLFNYENARNLLTIIAEQNKFVRFVHDYDRLPFMDYPKDWHKLHQKIMQNALCVVFLSPLHQKTYSEYVDFDIPVSKVIAPYIDVHKFKNFKIQRQQKGLALGELAIHKGFYNLYTLAQRAEFNIDFYNFSYGSAIDMGYLHLKPAVDYGLVPMLFNVYHEFFHLSEWDEPFGRTIAEAELCGIRVTCDKAKTGFYSYGWKHNEYKEKLTEGPEKFSSLINMLAE